MKFITSPKRYYKGTHRVISPEQTKKIGLKKIKSSGLEVFKKIIRIDMHDILGIPVYAAIHNNKFNNSNQPSWGKGVTASAAYVSSMMERAERYSASDAGQWAQEIVYASFKDINRQAAISRWDFVPCNLQRKLYTKSEINKQIFPWVKCFSLSRNKEVFVPANLVYLKSDWCQNDFSDTTGLAAGNNIEEAVLHALCEIIERHLEDTIHWNRLRAPLIDNESINKGELKKIIRRFTQKNINLHLSYLTGDFKIPAIRAFAYPKEGPYIKSASFYYSIGVHPDKTVAAMRALTELAQSRACALYKIKNKYIKIGKSGKFPSEFRYFLGEIIRESNKLCFDNIPSYDNGDLVKDIKFIIDLLHAKGCEIIVKDLTHPLMGIPTVRVLVQGLQPGILGIGIANLNHKAARLSAHLKYQYFFVNNIKNITLWDDRVSLSKLS